MGENAVADVHGSQQVPPDHLHRHHLHHHPHHQDHHHHNQCHHLHLHHQWDKKQNEGDLQIHLDHLDPHPQNLVDIEKEDFNEGHEEQLYRACRPCRSMSMSS